MNSILIAGVAGFIGTNFAKFVLEKDYEVVGIDNFITGSIENILELEKVKSFSCLTEDISHLENILSKDISHIIHLASPASPPKYMECSIETLEVNSAGTQNLLKLATAIKVPILFASTSEVYGDPAEHPQKETYWGKVNPIGPRSMYDESKRYGEALAMAYYKEHNTDIKIARIFNTYGPFMAMHDGRVVTNFIFQALSNKPVTIYGDGSQTRSFCYIDDMVLGLWEFLCSGYNLPVNLGNPDEITILKLAKLIIKMTGSKSKLEFLPLPKDDPIRRCPDISLAKSLFDWEPKIGLEEGLEKTIKWYKENYF